MEVFAGHWVAALRGEKPQGRGLGMQGAAIGEPARGLGAADNVVGTDALARVGQGENAEGLFGAGFLGGNVEGGEVEFLALRVDHNMDASVPAALTGLFREGFDGGEAAEIDGAAELPALREGDGGADAGVGAGAQSEGDRVDLFPFERGGMEGGGGQRHGAGDACAGFGDGREGMAVGDDGGAAAGGGEVKGQDDHGGYAGPSR